MFGKLINRLRNRCCEKGTLMHPICGDCKEESSGYQAAMRVVRDAEVDASIDRSLGLKALPPIRIPIEQERQRRQGVEQAKKSED